MYEPSFDFGHRYHRFFCGAVYSSGELAVQMWKICIENTHAHGINMNFYWCVFTFMLLWKLWQTTWRKICVLQRQQICEGISRVFFSGFVLNTRHTTVKKKTERKRALSMKCTSESSIGSSNSSSQHACAQINTNYDLRTYNVFGKWSTRFDSDYYYFFFIFENTEPYTCHYYSI